MNRVKEIENRLNKLHEEIGVSNDRMRIVEEMERLENEKSEILMIKTRSGMNEKIQDLGSN